VVRPHSYLKARFGNVQTFQGSWEGRSFEICYNDSFLVGEFRIHSIICESLASSSLGVGGGHSEDDVRFPGCFEWKKSGLEVVGRKEEHGGHINPQVSRNCRLMWQVSMTSFPPTFFECS
jgi:hypothetical protein